MKTHQMSKTRIYKIWKGMRTRCNNKNCISAKYYYNKGITICDRWNKFENFYEDMSDGYNDSLTIDRIDSEKGYSKENCRWATQAQQNLNYSKNRVIEYGGERKTLKEWAESIGVTWDCLFMRIKNGWELKRALNK